MPERTEVDWQALDHRIAREVMGWLKWDELPVEACKAYWVIIEEEPNDWTLDYCHEKWWFVDESGCPDYEYSIEDWQPHNDVTQAMVALYAALTKTGRHITADLAIRPPPGCCHLIIHDWSRDEEILGERIDDEKYAICLALEKFMEANC